MHLLLPLQNLVRSLGYISIEYVAIIDYLGAIVQVVDIVVYEEEVSVRSFFSKVLLDFASIFNLVCYYTKSITDLFIRGIK